MFAERWYFYCFTTIVMLKRINWLTIMKMKGRSSQQKHPCLWTEGGNRWVRSGPRPLLIRADLGDYGDGSEQLPLALSISRPKEIAGCDGFSKIITVYVKQGPRLVFTFSSSKLWKRTNDIAKNNRANRMVRQLYFLNGTPESDQCLNSGVTPRWNQQNKGLVNLIILSYSFWQLSMIYTHEASSPICLIQPKGRTWLLPIT